MARVAFVEAAKRVGSALGWVVLFAIVAIGVTIGLAWLLPAWGGADWKLLRDVACQLIGFGTATALVGKLLNQQSWERMGWRTQGGLAPRVLRGVGLGLGMAVLAVGLAILGARTTVAATPDWHRWPAIAVPLALMLLIAALSEELAFRGYPLRRLADGIGRAPAIVVLAVGFGLAHTGNPSATAFSTINVGLAAVWLSFAFFSPGGIGLAWGLHFGWNAGLALLFDAPVSGYRFQVPAVDYAAGRHAWVDGGAFGPEGGLVSTIVILAGICAVLGARLKRPREWLVG